MVSLSFCLQKAIFSIFSKSSKKHKKYFNFTGTNSMQQWSIDDLIQVTDQKTLTVQSPSKRTLSKSKAQILDSNNGTHGNHKRPSALDSTISKRLKSTSTVSSYNAENLNSVRNNHQQHSYSLKNHGVTQQQQQKSPHLLQHLMAPTPLRTRKYNGPANKNTTENGNDDTQWNRCNNEMDETKIQTSDSVLKNLLVSGCDISAGYVCHIPIRSKKLAKA